MTHNIFILKINVKAQIRVQGFYQNLQLFKNKITYGDDKDNSYQTVLAEPGCSIQPATGNEPEPVPSTRYVVVTSHTRNMDMFRLNFDIGSSD
jgi:hypothetical protein